MVKELGEGLPDPHELYSSRNDVAFGVILMGGLQIHRVGIKPMTRQAVYPLDTLDKIRDVTMGHPKKVAQMARAKR